MLLVVLKPPGLFPSNSLMLWLLTLLVVLPVAFVLLNLLLLLALGEMLLNPCLMLRLLSFQV